MKALLSKLPIDKLLALAKNNALLLFAVAVIVFQQFHIQQLNEDLEISGSKHFSLTQEFDKYVSSTDMTVLGLEQEARAAAKQKDAALEKLTQFKASVNIERKDLTPITEIAYVDNVITLPFEDVTGSSVQTGAVYRALSPESLKQITHLHMSFSDHMIDFFALGHAARNELALNPFEFKLEYTLRFHLAGQLAQVKTPDGRTEHFLRLIETDPATKKMVSDFLVRDLQVFTVDQRNERFHWWAPKIDLSISLAGVYPYSPRQITAIGFSAFGYGLSPDNLSYRFLRSGIGFNKKGIYYEFTPALVNLSQFVPMVYNSWVGLSCIVGLKKDAHLGLTFSVSL